MADIDLVIKIPEEMYKWVNDVNKFFDDYGISDFIDLVEKGTPLPKGHGVLKDVTNLMRGLYTDMQTVEETFTSSDVYKMIDKECPTIIEADTESEG